MGGGKTGSLGAPTPRQHPVRASWLDGICSGFIIRTAKGILLIPSMAVFQIWRATALWEEQPLFHPPNLGQNAQPANPRTLSKVQTKPHECQAPWYKKQTVVGLGQARDCTCKTTLPISTYWSRMTQVVGATTKARQQPVASTVRWDCLCIKGLPFLGLVGSYQAFFTSSRSFHKAFFWNTGIKVPSRSFSDHCKTAWEPEMVVAAL